MQRRRSLGCGGPCPFAVPRPRLAGPMGGRGHKGAWRSDDASSSRRAVVEPRPCAPQSEQPDSPFIDSHPAVWHRWSTGPISTPLQAAAERATRRARMRRIMQAQETARGISGQLVSVAIPPLSRNSRLSRVLEVASRRQEKWIESLWRRMGNARGTKKIQVLFGFQP
jgi:hypothetical protein